MIKTPAIRYLFLLGVAALTAGCGSLLDVVRAQPDAEEEPALAGEWLLVARDAYRGTSVRFAEDDGQLGAEGDPRVLARSDCRYDSVGVGWGFRNGDEPWIVGEGTGECDGWYTIGAFFGLTGTPIGWISGHYLGLGGSPPPPAPLPPHDGSEAPFGGLIFSQECGEVLYEYETQSQRHEAGAPRDMAQILEDLIAEVCDFGRMQS